MANEYYKAERVCSVDRVLLSRPSELVRDVSQVSRFIINASWVAVLGRLDQFGGSMLHGRLHKVGRHQLTNLHTIIVITWKKENVAI